MKFRYLRLAIIVIFLFAVKAAKSQSLVVNPYTETTQTGMKAGTRVGVATNDGYELGVFYQEDASLNLGAEMAKPRFYEQRFYGAYFGASIIRERKYNVNFNVRTGVTNGEYFTITPSVTGNLNLNRFIALHGGVGVRSLRPTLMAGVRFSL